MTKIIEDRLSPTSRRLMRDIVGEHPAECRTAEFESALREELTGYNWTPEAIEQALKEIGDVARRTMI